MKADLASENAYAVLGVSRDADLATIRRAFRALAIRHHPDAQPPEEKANAAHRFARVNRAHEILRDSEKRRQYDELLARGRTPTLDRDVGEQGQAASLADIIGDVQSLGLGSNAEDLLAKVPEDLRERLLKPMLISGTGFRERPVDVLPFWFAPNGNGAVEKMPSFERAVLGTLTQAVLVPTELRLILLTTYTFSMSSGNSTTIQTTFRSFGLAWAGVEKLRLIQDGRASPRYRLELLDREGVRFELDLIGDRIGESLLNRPFRPSRLARVLLVAARHGLRLEAAHEGSHASEHRRALPKTLAPLLTWLVPFVLVSPFLVIDQNMVPWIEVAAFLDRFGLTAMAASLLPILAAVFHGRILRAWRDHVPEGAQ
jgi:hypothetical protein